MSFCGSLLLRDLEAFLVWCLVARAEPGRRRTQSPSSLASSLETTSRPALFLTSLPRECYGLVCFSQILPQGSPAFSHQTASKLVSSSCSSSFIEMSATAPKVLGAEWLAEEHSWSCLAWQCAWQRCSFAGISHPLGTALVWWWSTRFCCLLLFIILAWGKLMRPGLVQFMVY